MITIREGDRLIRLPAFQAVLRAQMTLAEKGNGPAHRAVQRQIQKIEGERHALRMELLKTAIEYKADAKRIREERRRKGLPDDDPDMPRPEDVLINMLTHEVTLCRPDFYE